MELTGLYSNPLKKISDFKKSLPLLNVSNVGVHNSDLSDEDSIAHFCKIGKYGDIEVTRYRQKQKILSEQERTQVIKRYQNGESTYQLAEAFGCHRSTISNTLKKAGVKVQHHRVNDGEIVQLYESGLTSGEIAKKFKVSSSVIIRTLHKNNVNMRSSWESRKRM